MLPGAGAGANRVSVGGGASRGTDGPGPLFKLSLSIKRPESEQQSSSQCLEQRNTMSGEPQGALPHVTIDAIKLDAGENARSDCCVNATEPW